MGNIADTIEDYILHRLTAEQNGKIVLKRSDIANEISCAPSQISYVLSTRFTQSRGFIVESRRGLGGFICIGKMPMQDLIYQDILSKINTKTTIDDVGEMINYLLTKDIIQKREAALILQTISIVFDKLKPKDRVTLIKSLVLTLINFS